MTAPQHITSDDFCRPCRGKGGHYEAQPAYDGFGTVQAWQPCWLCGGSGKQSVLIIPREALE